MRVTPTLIILVLVLVGLGVYVWVNPPSATPPPVTAPIAEKPEPCDPEVDGEPIADQDPEFDVGVDLRQEGPRHVLEFTVTEKHGWAVNCVYVEFWNQEWDEETQVYAPNDYRITHLCKFPLGFNETLVDSTTLIGTDLPEGVEIGTRDNWGARVVQWGRAFSPPKVD